MFLPSPERPDLLWGLPSLLLFLSLKQPGHEADLSPHLVLRLGMSGAVPLFPFYSFMSCPRKAITFVFEGGVYSLFWKTG
jgi:hypothetical protein